MIVSFRHKGLERLYRDGSTKGVQAAHAPKLLRILSALDQTWRSGLRDAAFSKWLRPGEGVVRWERFCVPLCATRMNRGGLRWTFLDGDVPLTSTDAPQAHPCSPPSADS